MCHQRITLLFRILLLLLLCVVGCVSSVVCVQKGKNMIMCLFRLNVIWSYNRYINTKLCDWIKQNIFHRWHDNRQTFWCVRFDFDGCFCPPSPLCPDGRNGYAIFCIKYDRMSVERNAPSAQCPPGLCLSPLFYLLPFVRISMANFIQYTYYIYNCYMAGFLISSRDRYSCQNGSRTTDLDIKNRQQWFQLERNDLF